MTHGDGAALLPFQALRFRAGLPGGLSGVIGPPADITSSEEALAFVRDRPFSAVRLELSDDPHGVRFLGARRLFDRWVRDGTLQRDPTPSYYVYEQEFVERGVSRTRRGIFGLAPLDAPETVVLPHENTWEENLRRRKRILRDLEASLSPILLLHDAPARALAPLFDAVIDGQPDNSGYDDDGQRHRIWVVTDARRIEEIAALMRGRRYMIADGHHRFAAAKAYHRERRRPETGFIPALCIAQDDPGVVLRAIHRLLRGPLPIDLDTFLTALSRWFQIEPYPGRRRTGAELSHALRDDLPPTCMLVMPGERNVLATLRSYECIAPLMARRRPALRQLDVTIATDVVLAHGLGIDPGSPAIEYTNDPEAVVEAVRTGEASLGILLRPPRIEQVIAVAESHGRMPPKSTSFVPKVPLGLVMYDFLASRDDADYARLV